MTSPESTLTLAPAAGSGLGKKFFDELLARPDFVKLMVDAALGGLEATTHFYNPGTKEVVSRPDYKTRLQALVMLIANAEGEPVKRIIHQHLGGTGSVDPLAALRESEALRDAAKAMLEKAEWRTSGKQAYKVPKKAQPVDAESV